MTATRIATRGTDNRESRSIPDNLQCDTDTGLMHSNPTIKDTRMSTCDPLECFTASLEIQCLFALLLFFYALISIAEEFSIDLYPVLASRAFSSDFQRAAPISTNDWYHQF